MVENLKLIGKFLISRQFLTHMGLGIFTFFMLIFGTSWYLSSYTNHGEENNISVPNLVGMKIEEVPGILESKGLRYTVDSAFTDKFPKGTVTLQDPHPTDSSGQFVKEGRNIYLTVVAYAPLMVSVPDLVYKSKKHAEGILRIVGLKVTYKYKPYAECKDCVIEQIYKGKKIEAGTKIEKGSTIQLVLGQGKGNTFENVPLLEGKTIDEANSALGTVSLSLSIGSCEGCKTKKDSLNAVITRQSPSAGEESIGGSVITVWLKANN
jgi:eukaryotic-like serine/threonine-protein kinase